MKLLILAALFGLAMAGEDMFNEWKMMKKWAMEKVEEQCWGEENTRKYMVLYKRAMTKCSGMEFPELDLPMFKPPMRFIQALMNGVRDMQKEKGEKLFEMLTEKKEQQQSPMQTMAFVPYPMMPQHQDKDKGEMKFMKKMMQMMMLKKFMKKMKGKNPMGQYMPEDDDDDDMDMEGGFFRNFAEDMDLEDFFNTLLDGMQDMKRARTKRATDSELLDLGDKLVEKLKMKQDEMKAKMSNMTCVLHEMKVVDKEMNLDLAGMLTHLQQYDFEDPWLKKKAEKINRLCFSIAQSTPREVLNEFPDERLYKLKSFMGCCKKYKMKVCMKKDIKDKLEKNFKPLGELVDDTGMDEYSILKLTYKLLKDH